MISLEVESIVIPHFIENQMKKIIDEETVNCKFVKLSDNMKDKLWKAIKEVLSLRNAIIKDRTIKNHSKLVENIKDIYEDYKNSLEEGTSNRYSNKYKKIKKTKLEQNIENINQQLQNRLTGGDLDEGLDNGLTENEEEDLEEEEDGYDDDISDKVKEDLQNTFIDDDSDNRITTDNEEDDSDNRMTIGNSDDDSDNRITIEEDDEDEDDGDEDNEDEDNQDEDDGEDDNGDDEEEEDDDEDNEDEDDDEEDNEDGDDDDDDEEDNEDGDDDEDDKVKDSDYDEPIIKISNKYNFPPMNIIRQFLAIKGHSKQDIKNMLRNPSKFFFDNDVRQIEVASKLDVSSAVDNEERERMATEFEENLGVFLTENGIKYRTQEELSEEQTEKYGHPVNTPDFLIETDLEINGKKINWIDAKNFYGGIIPTNISSMKKQIRKYVEEYGSGAIKFRYGFNDKLKIDDVFFF
jgi:hypothetical protein